MKKFVVLISTILFLCGGIGTAGATVLTFDDIGTSGVGWVYDYGGLGWYNMRYINSEIEYPGVVGGYLNGRVSGKYVAFNSDAQTASVSDGSFDFNGTYLTGAWNDELQVQVQGYYDDELLYDVTVTVFYDYATWFDFNFVDIDTVVFNSFGGQDANPEDGLGGEHFAMDNFTFNEEIQIPEPATMLLFGFGLIGLAGFRRKFRKR